MIVLANKIIILVNNRFSYLFVYTLLGDTLSMDWMSMDMSGFLDSAPLFCVRERKLLMDCWMTFISGVLSASTSFKVTAQLEDDTPISHRQYVQVFRKYMCLYFCTNGWFLRKIRKHFSFTGVAMEMLNLQMWTYIPVLTRARSNNDYIQTHCILLRSKLESNFEE